jgi:hypothetical protein
MAETTKKDGGINGVLVLGGGVNAEHWMKEIKKKHEAPDRYGKSNKVEFDITDEYIGYQVV